MDGGMGYMGRVGGMGGMGGMGRRFVRRGQLSRGQGANLFLWKARPHPNLLPQEKEPPREGVVPGE